MRPETEAPALPSSLAPLPAESLPGYLLRLAWRLELAPARIAELCGLVSSAAASRHGRIPVDPLIGLPRDVSARLASAAGLDSGEAAGLTLAGYRRADPALASPRSGGRGSIANAYIDTWAASISSRYCPECLNEDARRAEGAFGGSWKLGWHLPVVFACTTHRRLLEHTCPACGNALNGGSARRRASLIACPDASGLHPHQCRNPAGPAEAGRRTPLCGGRLDRLASAPPAPLPRDDLERMLRLQAEISQALNHEHAAGAAGTTYFPDLLAAARLLILSWPHGSDTAGPHAIASLIDEHAGPARKSLIPGQDSTGQARYGRAPVNAWGPPGPPAQCGALILAAHTLIAGRSLPGFRDQVQNLANAAARTSQRAFWAIRNMEGLSHALRRALAPRGQGFRHAAAGARQFPPSRDCLFTIEEVPPHLPRKWYDDHLAALAARIAHPNSWTPRHLRRVASLKLAEMTAGGTWKQCARQLDIPHGAAERSVRVLRDQIGNSGLWEEFDEAAGQIARNLDEDGARANYAVRRRLLLHWEIPAAHWKDICSVKSNQAMPLDPAIGTVLIWESITQADHLHSPLLTRMRREGTGRSLNDKIALLRTPAARKGSHLTVLNRIEKYTTLLARNCDVRHSTEIDPNDLLPWEP